MHQTDADSDQLGISLKGFIISISDPSVVIGLIIAACDRCVAYARSPIHMLVIDNNYPKNTEPWRSHNTVIQGALQEISRALVTAPLMDQRAFEFELLRAKVLT